MRSDTSSVLVSCSDASLLEYQISVKIHLREVSDFDDVFILSHDLELRKLVACDSYSYDFYSCVLEFLSVLGIRG